MLANLSVLLTGVLAVGVLSAAVRTPGDPSAPDGWKTTSPRDEIRPEFGYHPRGGPNRSGSLRIRSDERQGLQGAWTRAYAVQGGRFYRFSALRRVEGAASARRAAVARVIWTDASRRQVVRDEPSTATYQPGVPPRSEPEYPDDRGESAPGWTEVSGLYRAPSRATQAVVELEFRWAPRAAVEWSEVGLTETAAPAPRTVRLATVHYRPNAGKTPDEKRLQFAPLIEEAARKKADLVVLPETLTFYRTGLGYAECAEPIPGPSTDYFGKLARKHGLYIVAGLLERDRHLIYNVAVLLDPEGKVAGKYRKVCLPRSEIEGGIAPGYEYPVFETRFGKLGMMVCYDGFFPEVARELSNTGQR